MGLPRNSSGLTFKFYAITDLNTRKRFFVLGAGML